MATEIKANVMKMKSNEDGSSSKGKAIVTKSNKQVIDSNQKSNVTVTKSEAKEKTMASSSKTVSTTTAVKVKSQRKVYTLPGQKHDPPEEREPLRLFYESLSHQIPSSQMAEFWMMEHGLLSPERAKRAYERKQKSKQQIKMGTPQITNRAENSQKQQASKNGDMHVKKRTISGSDDDDDNFIVKRKKGTRFPFNHPSRFGILSEKTHQAVLTLKNLTVEGILLNVRLSLETHHRPWNWGCTARRMTTSGQGSTLFAASIVQSKPENELETVTHDSDSEFQSFPH